MLELLYNPILFFIALFGICKFVAWLLGKIPGPFQSHFEGKSVVESIDSGKPRIVSTVELSILIVLFLLFLLFIHLAGEYYGI